jgi:hypothetical protein
LRPLLAPASRGSHLGTIGVAVTVLGKEKAFDGLAAIGPLFRHMFCNVNSLSRGLNATYEVHDHKCDRNLAKSLDEPGVFVALYWYYLAVVGGMASYGV